jgi:hypothetical protein
MRNQMLSGSRLDSALVGQLEELSLSCCGSVGAESRHKPILDLLCRERKPLVHHGVEQGSSPFSVECPEPVSACVGKSLRQTHACAEPWNACHAECIPQSSPPPQKTPYYCWVTPPVTTNKLNNINIDNNVIYIYI